MGWLVDAELASAGEGDICNLSPAEGLDLTADYFMPGHGLNKRLDIVADKEEFLLIVPVGRVNGQFGRGQAEDQPTSTSVDVGKLEHIAEKEAIGGRVGTIDDGMRTGDHGGYQI